MSAITVTPLRDNLLRCLAEDIVEKFYSPDDPVSLSKVTVILPHRRGTVYLRHYLLQTVNSRQSKPLICPRLLTIEDFINEVAVSVEDRPGRALSPTDQAWLLFRLVQELGIYKDVASTWDRFFAWGVRLAELLEEVDREMVDPQGIVYPEDVPDEARVLLERLKEIHEGFGLTLSKQGFTTGGKRFRLVAEKIAETGIPKGAMYLAGFYAMSRSEDLLFRHLFSKGAEILWHADSEDLPPLYKRWQEEWRVKISTRESAASEPAARAPGAEPPRIHFHEAYDLHAELRSAQAILAKDIRLPDECALVLPDPSALIPTLYHIPEGVPLNVSMGYPLERTSVATLFEGIMSLEEGRNREGAYYYRDYLGIIRHPYVRRLATPHGKEGRIVLHLLEEKVRDFGKPYLSDDELMDLLAVSDDPERDRRLLVGEGLDMEEARAHVGQLHGEILRPWQEINTPHDLAATVSSTARFLLLPFLGQPLAGPVSDEHALDNEFVYALETQVIPSLEDALFARQTMGKQLLFSLLRDLIHMARVPFEGRPLKGLQILGLLESRLLSFEKVIVIDVNEGIVPPSEDVNPLLPEPLKPAAGLPSRERDEAITRYHFGRLIGSAREVHLVWQSSTAPSSSGIEAKKTRSRFVEALLWSEERKAGRLLDDVVTREVLTISPKALLRAEGLVKTETDVRKLDDFIRARSRKPGLSATLLDTYLRCPLQFYYQYMLGLEPPAAPSEEIDSGELGQIIHRALETYFRPYENREYANPRDCDEAKLISIFTGLYQQSAMYRCLAPEKRFFLEHTVAHRLRTYLSAVPETTVIESLEQEYKATISTSLGNLALYGKVDRIDSRDGRRIILDYKTGWVDAFGATRFENRLARLELPKDFDYQGLSEVKDAIKEVQLPLYVFLVSSAAGRDAGTTLSAYVELRKGGKELYFVAPEKIEALRDSYASWFAKDFPRLLAYIIDHMIKSTCFYPATDEGACSFCDFNSVCSLSFA